MDLRLSLPRVYPGLAQCLPVAVKMRIDAFSLGNKKPPLMLSRVVWSLTLPFPAWGFWFLQSFTSLVTIQPLPNRQSRPTIINSIVRLTAIKIKPYNFTGNFKRYFLLAVSRGKFIHTA